MAQMIGVWFEAVFELRLGNAERVLELAREGETLVDEFALAQGRTAFRWFRGWAQARLGKPREGYALIREAYEENTRLGMLSGATETLGYAAEALLLAGDLDGAREELDQALQISARLDERIYLPQLLTDRSGDCPSRRRCSRRKRLRAPRNRRGARYNDAAWFELLATAELAEHGDATSAERQALRALMDRVTEASGTVAFARARALLDRPMQR